MGPGVGSSFILIDLAGIVGSNPVYRISQAT
jgi:hypothetical protein